MTQKGKSKITGTVKNIPH